MSSNMYPNVGDATPYAGVDFEKSVSGMYTVTNKTEQLELKIDVDQPGPYQEALKVVSGTLKASGKKKWSGKATTAFFTTYLGRAVLQEEPGAQRVAAQLAVWLSDGGRREGSIDAVARTDRHGAPSWDVTIKIESATFVFKGVTRKSKHYRDIKLDVDYVKDCVYPTILLKDFDSPAYGMMKDRSIDIFTAFEDAGLKLNFNWDDTQKVQDPTPYTPWSEDDMVMVMNDNFQQGTHADDSIWCLMATQPPDQRYMGFSFDYENKRGFGLFLGHDSFTGITSKNPKMVAKASRRILHYLVHECGHCMGLKHPFEEGDPQSMTWMNYAWKYDSLYKHNVGDFYKSFKFTFAREELLILRHQPDKIFKQAYKEANGEEFDFVPASKSAPPDYLGGGYEDADGYGDGGYGDGAYGDGGYGGYDDEEELEDEDEEYGGYQQRPTKKRKTEVKARKVVFDINTKKTPYKKGDIVELQASLTNVGKLPAKIEANFEPGGGNLTVYVTDPEGYVKTVKPVVNAIGAPTRNYTVLGKPGSRDDAESYSESVPLLQSSYPMFNKVGTYKVKAVYQSGGMQMASKYSTITIEEEDEEDEAAKYEVAKAASLATSASYDQRSAPVDYWKKLASKTIKKKSERVQMMLLLLKGFAKETMKVSRDPAGGRKVELKSGAISSQKLLSDTDDLLNYYHKNPGDDPLNYSKLVTARSQLYVKEKKAAKADGEYAQLVADLVRLKEEKTGMVKRAIDEWEKLLNTPEPSTSPPVTQDRKKLQARFEKLFWFNPKEKFDVETEESGLGLSRQFNNFDDDHKAKASFFIDELKDLEEETDDLNAVLDYAEARQKSFEVNPGLYKWAIECYVVHSPLAKSFHISYPEPLPMAEEMYAAAALTETVRKGNPTENWMNYWRCDADFNFHHRHWHTVYRLHPYDAFLKRQGELFLYMHSQMLARYDAERESWGMKPVKAYEYNEAPVGFNAGLEFHKDKAWFVPRPSDKPWPEGLILRQQKFELKLLELYRNKSSLKYKDGKPINPNEAGFLIEATSNEYGKIFGSFHNEGHMAFCSGFPRGMTTYMGSAECAVRDPIFFRWHKRVDNVADTYFASKLTEMENENSGVIVEPSDVLILPGTTTPDGFDKISYGKWSKKDFPPSEIKTELKKAKMRYEWDNKLTHEPFSFHLRMRRSPGVKGTLNLTVRIFICQERHVSDRKKWIEMDKFVHRMVAKEDHCVIKRRDIHSSVIKRNDADHYDANETAFCKVLEGNCQCGWPYQMMIPRGTKDGEKWCVAVFVSNNDVDKIEVTTTCGSMSYCGTTDPVYPDLRVMGFPFATPISIKQKEVSIEKAMEEMSNFSMAPFMIYNNLAPEEVVVKPDIPVDVWRPDSIVPNVDEINFRSSRLTGRFRVLLDDKDFLEMGIKRVKLKLKGRGERSYTIHDMLLGVRIRNTLSIDPSSIVAVTYKGNTSMEVPPEGAYTDDIVLPITPALGNDYFVTFTIDNPGCYVKGKGTRANSYRLMPRFLDADSPPDNWDNVDPKMIRSSRNLYCVEKMVAC